MTRFILFPFCFLLYSVSTIYAQVTAGVTDNLIVGQTSVHLAVFAPNSGDYDIRYDSLDFDGDGQFDAMFTAEAAWVPDYVGGYTGIMALHPGFEIMLDSTANVRALTLGAGIDATQTWSDSNTVWDLYSMPFVGRYWGFTGQLEQYGNWLPPTSTAFVGFRIITSQDTLYGWFRVTAGVNPNSSPSAGLTVNGIWAIEAPATSNQPVDFVVAGITTDLVPGNVPLVLDQGPITFGGGDGLVDSLDLNQDGKYDMAFNVSVCNTFDCQMGQSMCIAMHEGITFVDGALNPKRYETGDTIWENANWRPWANPYLFGLLIESGLGFNGPQSNGEWLNNYLGYLGFRLVTPASDTLLGWIHIYTYSLAENGAYLEVLGWSIQHAPSHTPYAKVSMTPEKAVYCSGDYVTFEANTVGAEQVIWHFWDGTTDTSATATKILPDSTVTATFEAINQNGTTTVTQILEVSPLTLTVPVLTLDCAHPSGTPVAETNIPADLCWLVGADTACNPAPPTVTAPVPVTVIAQDDYGCIAASQVGIFQDTAVPDVTIEYDEVNHLLIAHSPTPNVTFYWLTMGWPVMDDTIVIAQSGTYTLEATAPNGCTAIASITFEITSTAEPVSDIVRIQPNPASDFLQIENRFPSDLYFKIFDTAGSLILESTAAAANSVSQLDIEMLPGGFYLLAAYDAGGKPLFFKKFAKQ